MQSASGSTTEETLEDRVCSALESNDLEELRTLLAAAHPADIADIIDRLDDDERLQVFRLLEPHVAAEVLDETDLTTTRGLIARLPAT